MQRRDVLKRFVAAATVSSITINAKAQTVPPLEKANETEKPEKTAKVEGATVLVTGSNRGIGLGFVKQLLAKGVKRVYATGRNPNNLPAVVALDPDRVVPLTLDVNNAEQRQAAAEVATDVTWLINNAGIGGSEDAEERRFLSATSLDDAKFVMETNCWSPVELARLFTPIILKNGGGAIINMLSVGAWYCVPQYASYSASKAAAAIATAGLRGELYNEPVLVSGVFAGGVATRMSSRASVSPIEHAQQVFDALARGETDILSGSSVHKIRDAVRADPQAVELDRIKKFYGIES